MIDIMMVLGAYFFSIDTAAYQDLVRTNEYRWPSQDRITRKPALQYVGPGHETICLNGVIYPEYKGGLYQMELLRAEAGLDVPQLLVDGTGLVWGKYVIERIEETKTVFFSDGTPRKIEFKLDLRRYGDDADGALS